jgi:hypothetical protein
MLSGDVLRERRGTLDGEEAIGARARPPVKPPGGRRDPPARLGGVADTAVL